MNRCVILLLMFALNIKLLSAQKQDYTWVFGTRYNVDLDIVKGNILDFNQGGRIDTLDMNDSVANHNAEISDQDGNLLFYYNGCRVIDSTFQLMENGDSLNYNDIWADYCTNWSRYPGTQNSIVLPDPGNDPDTDSYRDYREGYYIIHKRVEFKYEPYFDIIIPELLYSYVDMTRNNGRGKVTRKNQTIFRTTNLVSGYLSACKHTNGEDWWMIQMQHNTNAYFKVLLTSDTIMVVDSQYIAGSPVFTPNSGVGQAVFTPDGKKWITNGAENQCLIYDFDRESGELSNLVRVMPQDSGIFYGLAVSPNSRFAYLSNDWDLFQVDLRADDIPNSLTHIAHIDSFPDPFFWSKFGQAQLAPDCKIYIVNGGTNNYLHVINKPDEKGKACDFRQHSIYLPNRNFNNSIPNFPHFRMDEDELCDPTITSIFGKVVWYRRDLKVWPNPSSGVFTVELPDVGRGRLVVTDMNGQLVETVVVESIGVIRLHSVSADKANPDDQKGYVGQDLVRIDITNYPAGRYNVEFWPDKNIGLKAVPSNSGRVFYGAQVVKVK